MALKQYSRRTIYGLNAALDAKVGKEAIRKTLDDVLNATSPDAVVGAGAITALKTNLEDKINKALQTAQSIIDDTATSGNKTTWSVDKIKEFVASVDDTVVVQNIQDRDQLKAYSGLIAYVIDTSADKELGADFRGKPVAYMYADGKWNVLSPLAKEIDSTVFVKYSDIVNNLTDGGVDKLFSAEMGKYLAQTVIPQAKADAMQVMISETITVAKDNKMPLTYTPMGNLVFDSAEINTDDGIVVIDAVISGTKEVTLQDTTDYEGKVARVTYLANQKEVNNTNANNGSKSGSASSTGSASGSASATGSASGSASATGSASGSASATGSASGSASGNGNN